MSNSTGVPRLWSRLAALRRRLLSGMSAGLPSLAALDLSVPQSLVLFRLVEEGPQTIGALAGTAGRSQPATSHLVAGLERRGLVERAPDPRDARRTQVRATAAARRIASRVERVRMQGLRTALRGVPAPTVRRFEEALAGLLEAMEKTR